MGVKETEDGSADDERSAAGYSEATLVATVQPAAKLKPHAYISHCDGGERPKAGIAEGGYLLRSLIA